MKSRREKIEALLSSANDGERAAAEAALRRVRDEIPRPGTPEWNEGRRAFHAKIEFCLSRLGHPSLEPAEIRTIRMQARHRGSPWDRGAEALLPVYEKLLRADRKMLPYVVR